MAFENNAFGVDVSLWQPNVDWAALAEAGVAFGIAKATEGDNITDPQFAKNWPAMKAAGVIRGAYHFYRPAKDAVKQAALFARTAQLEAGDLPLALDLESSGGLAPAPLMQSILTCLIELERLSGVRPIVYTGPNFWNTAVAAAGAPDWTADYPLWIANYTTASKPLVPKGWSTWTIWQYTDHGKLNGVAGNVDVDRFNGTVADLRAWAGASEPLPPTPTPAELINNYIQALNARDFDALVTLYTLDSVRTGPSSTVQGAALIRAWYEAWLTDQYPGGSFTLGEVRQLTDVAWTFAWTCESARGAAQGQDTVGLQNGKFMYHATNY